jgi:hypothetical protein
MRSVIPADKPYLFVSYAREDLQFVRDLLQSIRSRSVEPWCDVDELQAGEPFWDEIRNAIDRASAVGFVISPDSIASSACLRELEFAISRQKRIIPICRRDPGHLQVPQSLAAVQWVLARDVDDQASTLDALDRAIRADWIWLRQHARWLTRAEQWRSNGTDKSRLLKGQELREAESWLQQPHEGPERPTTLHSEFVSASRRASTRRQLAVGASTFIAVLALALLANAAAIYYVGNLNRDVQRELGGDTKEQVVRALDAAVRAVAVCRYLPTSSAACDAASVNLGIAQRSSLDFERSVDTLSNAIDRFLKSQPRSNDARVRLASAWWERSVSEVALAESLTDDSDRSRAYKQAHSDLTQALQIFDQFPEEAQQRPLAVTQARILIAAGKYQEALDVLKRMINFSVERLMLETIAERCLGNLARADQLLSEYHKALTGGSESPQFKQDEPFFWRNIQCQPSGSSHRSP